MDNSMSACKAAAKKAGAGRCTQVRAYEAAVGHKYALEAANVPCGAINRTAPNDLAKVPADTADKAAIIEGLKASFAECDKAFASVTDANLSDMFDVFNAKRSRIGILWGTVSHDNEQYATLSLYLRLKGLAPPTSEK